MKGECFQDQNKRQTKETEQGQVKRKTNEDREINY